MGKFVMECPSCGKFTEASTFIFAKKMIECSCGYTINVKEDKLSSKTCSHCGNMVVYDQSMGEKALCPVCHEKINTRDSMHNLVEFSCPSCSCGLSADKNAEIYTCPLCDTQIDVQQQIKKEAIKNKGLASVIKYEGANDIFVWKHPIEDFNMGSQLIVHESQEAIFFQDGKALDLFGAGRYTLSTQNLPLIEELYQLPTNADTIFHSEVYFINMTTHMGIKWGTDSKVRLFDPSSGLHIEIGASGNFNLKVDNSRKLLLKIVGTENELLQGEQVDNNGYSVSSLIGKFKALIMNKVKTNLARSIKELSLNILEIDSYLDVLSEKIGAIVNETLFEYGLVMPEFYITTIVTPDEDPNFRRLKQQFADRTLLVREEEIRKAEAEAAQGRMLVQAQTEAEILKMKAVAEAEAYRTQAWAEAEEMRMKGYTYQQETARQVGLEAMQNGIVGSGTSAGALGELAGLGVSLGAMGSIIGMTKDAMVPVMNTTSDMAEKMTNMMSNEQSSNVNTNIQQNLSQVIQEKWTCMGCGATGITSKYCPDCGMQRPEPRIVWSCPDCGTKEIESRFCPNCGRKGE